jgi:hypothetical protein
MGILSFDSKTLNKVLNQHGLSKAWINILATHLSGNAKFEYILKSKEFKGYKLLESDLLEDLTIGEIGVLYEYSVTQVDRHSRKSNGQFFTPDDVASFMASYGKDFPKGIWLDPCSGIGNLSWHLVATQKDPEHFLINNLKLSDRDSLALLIARTLLTYSFQTKTKKLFHIIESNFLVFDFLSVADPLRVSIFEENSGLGKIPAHDFVIVNPPYLATKIDDRFETARTGDLYAYFLENVIKTSKGFISVTPQSFTNAAKFRSLRQMLLRQYENLTVFNFDNVPANIFKGIKFGSQNTNTSNSIRACIMIAKPGAGKYKISPLLRWRSHERELLFKNIEKTLSEIELQDDFFPKVGKPFKSLYTEVLPLERLSSICSSKPTKYPLYIPSSPRYFIPALMKPVKRASQKTIYFNNEVDRGRAYLLINSSLMYWWWRLRDGGMTLSQETLLSLPMPKFNVNKNLILKLQESEKSSKVYKKNAGVSQENVKHPLELVLKLNQTVAPKFADKLLKLHGNSDIANLK